MYIVSSSIFIEDLCSVQYCGDLWVLWCFYGLTHFYGPKTGFADVPAHSGSSESIHSMFEIKSGTASYYY